VICLIHPRVEIKAEREAWWVIRVEIVYSNINSQTGDLVRVTFQQIGNRKEEKAQ